MQQDALDRIVEEWYQVRPDLDPSPLAVLGRLQRLAGLGAAESTPSSSPMAWPGNSSMSWHSAPYRSPIPAHSDGPLSRLYALVRGDD